MLLHLIFAGFVSTLHAAHVDPEPKTIPSMQLSNWFDSIIQWRNNRDAFKNWTTTYPVGIYDYRIADTYDASAIKADSFAVRVEDTVYGENSGIWGVNCELNSDGILTTPVYSYNNESTPFELKVEYMLPPYYPFYLVRYTITAKEKAVEGHLLDYVKIAQAPNVPTHGTTIDASTARPYSKTDLKNDRTHSFGTGLIDELGAGFSDLTYTVAETGSDNEPLKAFKTSPTLDNAKTASAASTTVGYSVKFKLAIGESASISFFRSFRATDTLLSGAITLAQSESAEKHFAAGTKEYTAWLSKGKMPTTLTARSMRLYKNSLIVAKNSQNPTIGTIAASFHPAYGLKSWTRDAFFSAFILAEAGYIEEGAKYFRWMAKAELNAQDQCFYTCYSNWDGNVVHFVDPQKDNVGMFLVGAYYMFLDTRTRAYLKEMTPRIKELTDILLNTVGYKGLYAPDYSIWEESSDPSTGEGFPTGYYAWTQAWAYAGLQAASKLQLYYFQNHQLAEQLRRRALDLNKAIHTVFEGKMPEVRNGTEDTVRGYYRQVVVEDDVVTQTDKFVDSSTFALYWLGVVGAPSSSSPHVQTPTILQKEYLHIPPTKSVELEHYEHILSRLQQTNQPVRPAEDRDALGIARYDGDIYFGEGKWSPEKNETSKPTAPWGVTTMFTLWAEIAMGIHKNIPGRLRWMTITSAHSEIPVGECVDHNNQFVWSSAPDVYEHGGVFVYSCLLAERKARYINPMSWNTDSVV